MADKDKDEQKQSSEEYRRFEDFVKKIAQVPKEEVDKLREQDKRKREQEKRAG